MTFELGTLYLLFVKLPVLQSVYFLLHQFEVIHLTCMSKCLFSELFVCKLAVSR